MMCQEPLQPRYFSLLTVVSVYFNVGLGSKVHSNARSTRDDSPTLQIARNIDGLARR